MSKPRRTLIALAMSSDIYTGYKKYHGMKFQGLVMLYCTTAPLDGYVTLPDRTPYTWMMMSHSICSKDFCDPWYTHPKKYYLLSVHLLPSGFVSIQICS